MTSERRIAVIALISCEGLRPRAPSGLERPPAIRMDGILSHFRISDVDGTQDRPAIRRFLEAFASFPRLFGSDKAL